MLVLKTVVDRTVLSHTHLSLPLEHVYLRYKIKHRIASLSFTIGHLWGLSRVSFCDTDHSFCVIRCKVRPSNVWRIQIAPILWTLRGLRLIACQAPWVTWSCIFTIIESRDRVAMIYFGHLIVWIARVDLHAILVWAQWTCSLCLSHRWQLRHSHRWNLGILLIYISAGLIASSGLVQALARVDLAASWVSRCCEVAFRVDLCLKVTISDGLHDKCCGFDLLPFNLSVGTFGVFSIETQCWLQGLA